MCNTVFRYDDSGVAIIQHLGRAVSVRMVGNNDGWWKATFLWLARVRDLIAGKFPQDGTPSNIMGGNPDPDQVSSALRKSTTSWWLHILISIMHQLHVHHCTKRTQVLSLQRQWSRPVEGTRWINEWTRCCHWWWSCTNPKPLPHYNLNK